MGKPFPQKRKPSVFGGTSLGPRVRGDGDHHFFSMFHIGGTDGTTSTPESRSER